MRKYSFYIVCKMISGNNEYKPATIYTEPTIERGINEKTVIKRYENIDIRLTKRMFPGQCGRISHCVIEKFDTRQEAENNIKNWQKYAKRHEKANS